MSTPRTDRGVTPSGIEVETSLDWLALTVHSDPWEVAAIATDRLLSLGAIGIEGWQDEGGAGRLRGFRRRAGAEGLTLFYEPGDGPGGEEREYCHLVIPGERCRELGGERLRSFLIALTSAGLRWRVTRIDLAADGAPFTPGEFYADVAAGNVRSGVHRSGGEEWCQLITGHQGAQETHTCYFGRRSSDRFARVYDAHGFTRFELEIKGDRAAVVAEALVERSIEELPALVIGQIRDFCDVAVEDRSEFRRGWILRPQWAAFVGALTRLRLPISRAPVSLERAAAWVRQSVSPTIAAVAAAAGNEAGFVAALLAEGRLRWGGKHRLLIAQRVMVPAFGGVG